MRSQRGSSSACCRLLGHDGRLRRRPGRIRALLQAATRRTNNRGPTCTDSALPAASSSPSPLPSETSTRTSAGCEVARQATTRAGSTRRRIGPARATAGRACGHRPRLIRRDATSGPIAGNDRRRARSPRPAGACPVDQRPPAERLETVPDPGRLAHAQRTPSGTCARASGRHGAECQRLVLGLGELAQLLQGLADAPRDVHLGDPEPLADLALGEVLGEAQAQDLAVAIG